MLSQEPWDNPSCRVGVPSVTTWNYRCYCFAEKWSWKNKIRWELSSHLSNRRLDERTDGESQINVLYLTSWCTHHNTVLGSKRCIRRTQCHQDALWRYAFLSACSCTGSTKLAPGQTFRWWIGEMHPAHQICIQEPHCKCLQWLSISLALIWYHTCRAKGMYQLWILFWRVSVQDSNSLFDDIGASHGSCTVFWLYVNLRPQPMIDTNYTYIKGKNQLG